MPTPHDASIGPIPNPRSRLILAPMEGVIDAIMRDILTGIGGYDRCVTEFVRVSQTVLPKRVFRRFCPELAAGGTTPAGTPVYLQLLGSDPELMARNAEVAAGLGAPGIDLNFGCPAKTVNKSSGGATLLKTPDRVGRICAAVRAAVPDAIPVTAKIRLGFDNDEAFEQIVGAVQGTGIAELVIHARTRRQGYRPPAHWHRLADAKRLSDIPLIANGELWSPDDVSRCQTVSGCDHFMFARGALCRPDLALAVRATQNGSQYNPMDWLDIQPLVLDFLHRNAATYEPRHAVNPVKQWLVYLKHYFPQAGLLFEAVKRIRDFDDMDATLSRTWHLGTASGSDATAGVAA